MTWDDPHCSSGWVGGLFEQILNHFLFLENHHRIWQ